MDVKNAPWLQAIFWATAAILLVFGVPLWLFPDHTPEYFAWPIKNPLTPIFIGAGYLNGVIFFSLVPSLSGQLWRRMRAPLGGIAVFTYFEGLATLLHSDIFLWDRPATWIWTFLYTVFPIVLTFGFFYHERRQGKEPVDGPPIHPQMRMVFPINAVVFGVLGVSLFIAPETVGNIWPWPLTPLTARVIAGWLMDLAIFSLLIAQARYWGTLRLVMLSSVVWPVLLLVGSLRFKDSFSSELGMWIYLGFLVYWLVWSAAWIVYHERKAREMARADTQIGSTAQAPQPPVEIGASS